MKKFTKNDASFVCVNCGSFVPELRSSSRDHCSTCLYGLHVDVNPGDRANSCEGVLVPVAVVVNQKGYVIKYRCNKCGTTINNKAAMDDNFEEMLKICKKQQ